ncbi:MAG TPA: alpha/beta hydrolase [Steroidobacteraceae bacterium]|nr:alpha/beta hydrolase [Steroidobacteraceae bacterium]
MATLSYRTIHANGIDFHVAVEGLGSRLALCLHGFPEVSFSWRHQIPLLASLGFQVWAPDLRGYGGTARPLGVDAYAIERLEEDVAGLIEASGCREVLLIGHDWGAAIAWNYAMFGRLPISRLIIMNVPHPALFAKGLRTLQQMRKSWYILFFQLPAIPEWILSRDHCAAIGHALRGMAVDKSRFPDEVLRVYRDNAAQPGALTAMINYYRALVRGRRRLGARRITTINVPTLLLWGEVDTALGKELTYGTDHYAPQLTLRYLPNVSHWVQQEAPETVNAMLQAWLSGNEVPQAPGAQAPSLSCAR